MNALRWLWRQVFEDDDSREPAPDEIVCLAEVEGEGTAEMWCGMLKQRGIHSMAKNMSALAHWRLGSPWEVHVLYRDLARARELLGLDDEAGDEGG